MARTFNEAQLAAQRAFKIRSAIKRGKDVSPDDRAWFEPYEAARLEKKAASAPPSETPAVNPGSSGEPGGSAPLPASAAAHPPVVVDHPQAADAALPDPPRLAPPPKVDAEPPRAVESKGKASGGADWRGKWRHSVKVDLGGKSQDVHDPREVLCVQGAALWAGLTKAMETALEKIDVRPYGGLTTESLFGSMVLTIDKVLPPDLTLKPEQIAIGGTMAMAVPLALNWKKLKEHSAKTEAQKKAEAAEAKMRENRDRLNREAEEREARLRAAQALAREEELARAPQVIEAKAAVDPVLANAKLEDFFAPASDAG